MDAEKVGRLRASIQEQIAQRLRAGEPPLQVLADYVTLKKSTHKNAKNAVMAFIRGVERNRRPGGSNRHAFERFSVQLFAGAETYARIRLKIDRSREETRQGVRRNSSRCAHTHLSCSGGQTDLWL